MRGRERGRDEPQTFPRVQLLSAVRAVDWSGGVEVPPGETTKERSKAMNTPEQRLHEIFWRGVLVFWFLAFGATVAALVLALMWRASLP